MEQNTKKNLNKYEALIKLGMQTLKKYGWNEDSNNMYRRGGPSNEEYSGYLNSCVSLIESTLKNKSDSYLMIRKLIYNEKTSGNPYYFAECFGIIESAHKIYKEKIMSENELDILLDKIEELSNTSFNNNSRISTGFKLWHKDFKKVFETYEFVNDTYERVFDKLEFKNFDLEIALCKDMLERIKKDISDYSVSAVKVKEQKKIKKIVTISDTKQVFIVHGHNIEKKEITARIIERLGLKPIILHEQANMGRTILKKLSECSDAVGFAIILLTSDDIGKEKDESDLKPRARQNVIFELGYFLAKLGEKNVCALYEKGVEIPTDYLGVTFIPFDSAGKWEFELVKELKAAGFDVNADNIL